MGYRNSVLTPKEKILIPADRWERFTRHVAKAAPFLPGHCDRNDGDCVSFGYNDAESLWLPRDMRTAFADGPEYVIHKMGRDGRFAPTVAAVFMLFRQDCLDSNPVECRLSGDFLDAQYGLDCLRDAGVWEGGAKCLLCREDIEERLPESADAMRNAFRKAWDAPGVPDIGACVAAAEAAMEPPEDMGISGRDAFSWKEWLRMKSRFGDWRLGTVSDGTTVDVFIDCGTGRGNFMSRATEAGVTPPTSGFDSRPLSVEIPDGKFSFEPVGFNELDAFLAGTGLPVRYVKSDGTVEDARDGAEMGM